MSDGRQRDDLRRPLRSAVPLLGLAALITVIVFTATGNVVVRSDDDVSQNNSATADADRDPVRQAYPEYVTGDECLFCHRRKIGPTWQQNPHQLTVRPARSDDPAIRRLAEHDADSAQQTQLVLGSKRLTRYLKRSQDYGRLDLFTAVYRPHHEQSAQAGTLHGTESAHWDKQTFAQKCAGCHTTAVDGGAGAFAAVSLDCFTCHGDVDLAHTADPAQVFLSQQNRDPLQVTSTCGQCHLRGGTSRSTGRPFPALFMAGDDLFRDFQVDLSEEFIASRPVIEQHIYQNVRDVIVSGITATTCLTCHDVHGRSTERHLALEWGTMCASCHDPESDGHELRKAVQDANPLANRSSVCEY